MNLRFILDENYLAFFILNKKMHNESKEVKDIKNKLKLDNNLGYKKILEESPLDSSIYLKNKNISNLISKFISTSKFNEIYKSYNDGTKEEIAIKMLKGYININDNELVQIKDNLWNEYKDGYYTLLKINAYNTSLFLLDKDVIKTIDYLKKTDEFKKIYSETEFYLKGVKKYWEEKKENIYRFLKRILKIDFNLNLIVYISHPNAYTGYSFDDTKIAWGHYKGIEDPNYNITYLVHEAMHALLPFEINETDINCYIKHTIIELISDYELYSFLKGESTLNEGHEFLDEYRKFIYPYWLKYIGLKDYEIKERLNRDLVSTNNLNTIDNINLYGMNIHEFIDFCNKEYMQIVKNNKHAETKQK